MSHRALILGALALGETTVRGLLEGEDVLRTAAALRALGAGVVHEPEPRLWRVRGFGVGGGGEPDDVLDLGNSGTSARLLAGILASHPFTSVLTGDASLRRRPMKRVTDPLSHMGARACRSPSSAPTSCCRSSTACRSLRPRSRAPSCLPA